jgi:putative spermidine/putrescine transport system permease protein
MNEARTWTSLRAAAAAAVYGFLIVPLLVVVLFSFSDKSFFTFPPSGFSLKWYHAAWASERFLGPAVRSIVLALLSTLIAVIITVPAALAMRKMRGGRVRAAVEFLFLGPLIVPALIVGIALLYSFTKVGLIDTFAGLLAAHALIVFPFVFRAVLTSVVNLQQHLIDASTILGAGPLYTFRRIVLPALVPGLAAGAIFAFIVSLDQFTVSLFVTQTEQAVLPVAIYKYLYDVNDPVVAAVSTVLVVFGLAVAVVIDRFGWLRHLGGTAG